MCGECLYLLSHYILCKHIYHRAILIYIYLYIFLCNNNNKKMIDIIVNICIKVSGIFDIN